METKIYLTDLSAYNQGYLIGEWLELPMEHNDLSKAISVILANGTKVCKDLTPHEEYFITDHEGFPINVNEYSSPYDLNKLAEKLSELNEHELKIVSFLLGDNIVNNINDAIDNVENVIIYNDMSMEDIAEQYIEECFDLSNVPDIIKNHIDYEAIARDMYIDGNYYKVDSDIYEVNI